MMTDAQRMRAEIAMLRRSIEHAATQAFARAQMSERLKQLEALPATELKPPSGYGVTCYPGGASAASTVIPVGVGEERGGIDFQLELMPIVSVEGTIVNAPESVGSISVHLVSTDELVADLGDAVITFTDQLTALSGVVTTEQGAPAIEHAVLLFSADRRH